MEALETRSVRLEPGSHDSPDDGVCIVELASILAGERFSDRPECVCEVIGAFLRGWNDRASYTDRQRLYPYASRVVGTGRDAEATRRRRDLCLEWAGADPRSLGGRLGARARIAWLIGLRPAVDLNEGAGAQAARTCFKRGGIDEAFALLDRLLEAGSEPGSAREPRLPAGWTPATLDDLDHPAGSANGNGNGNGHRRDELGIRATIAARERGRAGRRSRRSRSGR